MSLSELKLAKTWQNKMEGPLLELEKLGTLDADMADEIRNLVAEGIAEKFQEKYRTFPGERKGLQIRRDRVPAACTLKKKYDAHAKAIMDNTLPEPIAMARAYGNLGPPSQPRETHNRQTTGATSRVVAKEQSLPKGSSYRKPDADMQKKAPSGKMPAPKKTAVARKEAPSSYKRWSSSSTATLPNKMHKHWQNGLASSTHQAWGNIRDDPYAVLNKLSTSSGSRKAQENVTTDNQAVMSPVSPKKTITHSGQNASSKDPAASVDGATAIEVTTAAGKDDVDDKLSEEKSDGTALETEEQDTGVSQPTVDFGDDLIWLGD